MENERNKQLSSTNSSNNDIYMTNSFAEINKSNFDEMFFNRRRKNKEFTNKLLFTATQMPKSTCSVQFSYLPFISFPYLCFLSFEFTYNQPLI